MRMEENHDSAEMIWLLVRYWLVKIVEDMGGFLSSKAKLILKDMQIYTKLEKLQGFQKIVWHKLPMAWLKLNVDGFYRGNLESCGEVG